MSRQAPGETPNETPDNILYLRFFESQDQIRIIASIGETKKEQKIDRSVVWPKISCTYNLMETLEIEEAAFECPLSELAEHILEPFADEITSASEIVIVLPPSMLETPVDMLNHQQQPLFLQKPVSYRISNMPLPKAPKLSFPRSALIISDKTADPQRATKAVAERIAQSNYHDIKQANRVLLNSAKDIDLLLMSVHGLITNTAADHLAFVEGPVFARDFKPVKTPLVYFDSCRLGVSSRFLRTFKSAGSQYYVAPILSNEAGVSSTLTMRLFFEYLSDGNRPETALFKTRRALWERYKDEPESIRVWRSFPFRVYRLN